MAIFQRFPKFARVSSEHFTRKKGREVVEEPAKTTPTGAPIQAKVSIFSRRQFIVILGGSAAVITAAGYGLSAGAPSAGSNAPTLPWAVRVVRAGRGPRLGADGLSSLGAGVGPDALAALAAAARLSVPTPLRVPAKSVTPAASHPFSTVGGHSDDSHSGDGHFGGGRIPEASFPQPENSTWDGIVVLEVEVQNGGALPMLFSPGQLRLQIANGPTITPNDASRGPGPIQAGGIERLWVSYLAPSDSMDFMVEFTDAPRDDQRTLAVPPFLPQTAQS